MTSFCKKYEDLGWMDKKVMQAKILYLIEHNEFAFDQITQLIRLSEAMGLLDEVKFGNEVTRV